MTRIREFPSVCFGGRVLNRLALSATMLIASGCSLVPTHLHHPDRLKAAEEAKSEMSAYAEKAPEIYATILLNLERFKQEEDWLLGELAANIDTAFITALATTTGSLLATRRKTLQENIEKLRAKIHGGTAADISKGEELKTSIKKAKTAVNEAKLEVKKVKDRITERNAQIAFFQKLISEYPKVSKGLKEGEASITDLFGKLEEFRSVEVTYLDADGKPDKRKFEKFFEPDNADEKVPEAEMSEDLKTVLNAPGLALELATLGLQLAETKKKTVEAEFTYLQQRGNLMEDTLLATGLADALLKEASSTAQKLPDRNKFIEIVSLSRAKSPSVWSSKIDPRKKKVEEEKRIVKDASTWRDNVDRVHQKLKGLRYLAVSRSIVSRQNAIYGLELKRIDHQRSILRSAIADAAWRSLASSGINGLVAFEKGGFKP